MSDHYSMPRIPRTLDNGIAQDWLEYTDEPWGLVHMGDVVDMYPDELQYDMNVRNVKHSGEVSTAVYERNGELSMILLLDKRAGEQWVDYTGAVYHHKEDANE